MRKQDVFAKRVSAGRNSRIYGYSCHGAERAACCERDEGRPRLGRLQVKLSRDVISKTGSSDLWKGAPAGCDDKTFAVKLSGSRFESKTRIFFDLLYRTLR